MMYDKYDITNDPLNVLNMKRILPERHLLVNDINVYFKEHLTCLDANVNILKDMITCWNTEIFTDPVLSYYAQYKLETKTETKT